MATKHCEKETHTEHSLGNHTSLSGTTIFHKVHLFQAIQLKHTQECSNSKHSAQPYLHGNYLGLLLNHNLEQTSQCAALRHCIPKNQTELMTIAMAITSFIPIGNSDFFCVAAAANFCLESSIGPGQDQPLRLVFHFSSSQQPTNPEEGDAESSCRHCYYYPKLLVPSAGLCGRTNRTDTVLQVANSTVATADATAPLHFIHLEAPKKNRERLERAHASERATNPALVQGESPRGGGERIS